MNHRALGACLAACVACSGGGSTPLLDAGNGALPICDPIHQRGCGQGEKCTWIVDYDADPVTMADQVGHVGCAPAGGNAEGATCTDGAAMVNSGADTCVAGDLCLSGTCKRICDQQLVPGAGAGACDITHACLEYQGIFAAGNLTFAGICEPGCDPLTQRLLASKAEACGSADPTMPSRTCVPASSDFKSFACAPTLPDAGMQTDRMPPLGGSHGYFGNGCAPGFIPFYIEDLATGSMTTLCSGMCAPVKMDMAIATDPATPANIKPWGDTSALGKLSADAMPAAGNATCLVGKKGSIAADPMGKGVEDCRFLWFPLAGRDPTMALETSYNDTLGICFAYQKFVDVPVPGGTILQAEKSCAELPATAAATDPFGSAVDNGCYPLLQSRRGAHRPSTAMARFRIGHGAGPAVRHVFD